MDTNNITNDSSMPVDIPDELENILDDMPDSKRKLVEQTMIAGFSMIGQNSPDSAIAKKLTEEHISKFLDIQQKSMDYQYKDEKNNKIFISIMVFLH